MKKMIFGKAKNIKRLMFVLLLGVFLLTGCGDNKDESAGTETVTLTPEPENSDSEKKDNSKKDDSNKESNKDKQKGSDKQDDGDKQNDSAKESDSDKTTDGDKHTDSAIKNNGHIPSKSGNDEPTDEDNKVPAVDDDNIGEWIIEDATPTPTETPGVTPVPTELSKPSGTAEPSEKAEPSGTAEPTEGTEPVEEENEKTIVFPEIPL